jgi:hypothetical protein
MFNLDRKLRMKVKNQTANNWTIAISPDNQCIACAKDDSCMLIHAPFSGIEDPGNWLLSNSIQWIFLYNELDNITFKKVRFSANGQYLYVINQDDSLYKWNKRKLLQEDCLEHSDSDFMYDETSCQQNLINNNSLFLFSSDSGLYIYDSIKRITRIPTLDEITSCCSNNNNIPKSIGTPIVAACSTDKMIVVITVENILEVYYYE